MTSEMKLLLGMCAAMDLVVQKEYKVYLDGEYIKTQDRPAKDSDNAAYKVRNVVYYNVTKKVSETSIEADIINLEALKIKIEAAKEVGRYQSLSGREL